MSSRDWFRRQQDLSRMSRDVASQAEAEAGTNNEKAITPLRMAQGIGELAPGIGFDTLSNVLVVDPGFDSDTPGWGVTAFFDLSVAILSVTETTTIFLNRANGGLSLGNDIPPHDIYIVGLTPTTLAGSLTISSHVFSITLPYSSVNESIYTVAGGLLVLDGGVRGSAGLVTMAGGSVDLRNTSAYVDGEITNANLSAFNSKVKITADDPDVALGNIKSCLIDIVSGKINVTNSTNIHDSGGITDGNTYREIVNFSDLPHPLLAKGSLAATSDGGAAGIPALMYSNGTTWVVAAE